MKQLKLILAAMAILCLAACGPEKKSGSSGSSLKAPEGVKLNSTTSEGFVFKWNKVDAALSYDWQLLDEGNSQVKSGNETRMYVTVSGIESGVRYYFRVRSVGENGVSDWSEKIPAMLEGGGDPGTDPDPADEETYALFKIPAAEDEDALLRAFPGAEGCGMFICLLRKLHHDEPSCPTVDSILLHHGISHRSRAREEVDYNRAAARTVLQDAAHQYCWLWEVKVLLTE